MNNDALKNIIGQAISNAVSKSRNEFASLEEIYNEVSQIRGSETDDALKAQIRARLQECCSDCTAYLGKDDFFQTKEIHSGLWKNKITGESELTPYIINFIKQFPGIDTIALKEKLYQIIDLTPGDKALSLTRSGEMKIDQIMRNFVSHKDSHKDILFDAESGSYKMYYVGENEDIIDVDLFKNENEENTVYDIVSEEAETPNEPDINDVKLSFITEDLIPKHSIQKENKVYIRKNDMETWIKREKSRVKNGNIAEGLVFVAEKQKLHDIGRDDLAEKVKWMSRDSGDGYGYDILSYDVDNCGKEFEINIEVKSTSNLNDDFIMSANELRYVKEHRDSYRLYRVAKVKSNSPLCKVIKVDLDQIFNFEPNDFRVSLKNDD